jgi:ribonucleoside-diphosphate reductase beta chain
MSILFNSSRKYVEGENPKYPLFFGEGMSLHDMVDTTYPEIEELALLQRSQYWIETEVDLSSDQLQWPTLPENIQDIAVLNLAWQSHADTIAGRAPIMAIMPFVTNPELEELINQWQYFEQIHSRTYQHIIRSIFNDPERVRDRVANLEQAMDRLEIVQREFDRLHNLASFHTLIENGSINVVQACLLADIKVNAGMETQTHEDFKHECKVQLVKALGALYALESIQFFASFACTFKLADMQVMSGTADLLKLIAKDEALHTRFTMQIMNTLKTDLEWAPIFDELTPYFEEVMYEVVKAEKTWGKYLFSEGRKVVGLNSALICEYVDYLATGAFTAVGLTYNAPLKDHPLPWVEFYLDSTMVQVAPQERDNGNYRVGQVDGDVSDVDFDDFDFDGELY